MRKGCCWKKKLVGWIARSAELTLNCQYGVGRSPAARTRPICSCFKPCGPTSFRFWHNCCTFHFDAFPATLFHFFPNVLLLAFCPSMHARRGNSELVLLDFHRFPGLGHGAPHEKVRDQEAVVVLLRSITTADRQAALFRNTTRQQ